MWHGDADVAGVRNNEFVDTAPAGLSVEEIVAVLASEGNESLSPNVGVSQLDHEIIPSARNLFPLDASPRER